MVVNDTYVCTSAYGCNECEKSELLYRQAEAEMVLLVNCLTLPNRGGLGQGRFRTYKR